MGARAGEAEAPGAGRAARALWLTLAALGALRAWLAFVPTMHAWSLNHMRFLGPAWAWLPWALAALALVPALARRLAPALGRAGDWLAGSRILAPLACMAGAALLVWALPDRVRFVGDFLLRQGTVEQAEMPSVVFPQAMPLDVLLHYRIPLLLGAWGIADANLAGRMLGALEAALLAWLAIAFCRALGRRGLAALATASGVLFGGSLGLLTGYSKAFDELMLLTALAAVAGVHVVREGRRLLVLGFAVSLAVLFHRSALSLLPAMFLAWWLWLRTHGAGGAWRRPAVLLAFALPIVVVALVMPRIIADVMRWDTVHFTPAEVKAGGGPLRAALAGNRPLDLMNLALLLAPLSLGAAAAWLAAGARPRTRTLAFLAALALPLVLAAPFIHPAQGLFRDCDDFAATGVAIALAAAWIVGEVVQGAPRFAWIGLAAALGAAMPSLQWLALHADFERGSARAAAFVHEPPARTPAERAKTWDYLGIVNYRRERWSESADAFGRAAETGPSERILLQWAMATTNTGDLTGAAGVYRRLLERYPGTTFGWLGLGAVCSRLADATPPGDLQKSYVAESRRAANELLRLQPGNADALRLLEYLRQRYGPEPR